MQVLHTHPRPHSSVLHRDLMGLAAGSADTVQSTRAPGGRVRRWTLGGGSDFIVFRVGPGGGGPWRELLALAGIDHFSQEDGKVYAGVHDDDQEGPVELESGLPGPWAHIEMRALSKCVLIQGQHRPVCGLRGREAEPGACAAPLRLQVDAALGTACPLLPRCSHTRPFSVSLALPLPGPRLPLSQPRGCTPASAGPVCTSGLLVL